MVLEKKVHFYGVEFKHRPNMHLVAIDDNNSPQPLSITRTPELEGYGINLITMDDLL